MSSKYVPPAFRAKAPPAPQEFPALASVESNTSSQWKSKTSFAVLAAEWRDHAEEDAAVRAHQMEEEKRQAEKDAAEQRRIVRHKRTIDEVYDDADYDEPPTNPADNDDGWVTIERKVRKELTPEEKFAREQKREEEETRAKREHDSVWGDASGNTDWDYRDRRAVA